MDNKRKSPFSLSPEQSDPRRPSKIPLISPKSPPLTSEQSTEDLGKICLICACSPEFEQHGFSYGDNRLIVDYCLCLLDLDAEIASDTYVRRNPNLCFSTYELRVSGFCLMESTLYLFGQEKDLFSYELPASLLSSGKVLTLTRDLLTDVHCPMSFPKHDPLGCRTPNGKMLVLSSSHFLDEESSGMFELFNPVEREWTVLPDLRPLLLRQHNSMPSRNRKTSVCVRFYSFINNTLVLLIGTNIGNFTLDMEQLENGWACCDEFQFFLPDVTCFMLVRDGLCLMDWYSWVDGTVPRPYPRLSYPGLPSARTYFYSSYGSGITWLSNNVFCVARSHVHPITRKPHLIIDVCTFDSDDFQRKKDSLVAAANGLTVVPGVTVIKRFKFFLGPQAKGDAHLFNPTCLVSIP